METRIISFSVPGKPTALSRPRFRRTGKFVQVYNPQSELEEAFKNSVKSQLKTEDSEFLHTLLTSKKTFYISVGCVFYIPIQKNSSKKNIALKLNNEIRPDTRPDIDNYIKFVLDSLHNVFYLDDSCVTEISYARKQYSDQPRTDVEVRIEY